MSTKDMTRAIDLLEKKILEEVQSEDCDANTLIDLGKALKVLRDAYSTNCLDLRDQPDRVEIFETPEWTYPPFVPLVW